ncbi:hypothetical protein RJT34_10766 [Clitoria ternatea]|uniref:DUF4408 domain-containing protein n=1 Tax=Clitoria ternatea TaxID=43366 RepID=A0AAN9JKL8_CLITE
MDQIKHQNIATLTHNIKAHYYLLKLTQIFVSLSLFTFILSPSSLLVFLHYFKLYFSTFPFQLYTHNIDKNCMFLLCNGLLVFVGITKSFSNAAPSKYIEDGSHSQFPHVDVNEVMLEIDVEEKTSHESDEMNFSIEQVIEIKNCDGEQVQANIEKIVLVDEEQGKLESEKIVLMKEEEKDVNEEGELLDVFDDEEEEKGSENGYFLIEENMEEEEEEEEEEYVEEESCMLSTEELNKKFEDFIRKMKEDLRIEAQRQLVMV